jgi:hypothetical protein
MGNPGKEGEGERPPRWRGGRREKAKKKFFSIGATVYIGKARCTEFFGDTAPRTKFWRKVIVFPLFFRSSVPYIFIFFWRILPRKNQEIPIQKFPDIFFNLGIFPTLYFYPNFRLFPFSGFYFPRSLNFPSFRKIFTCPGPPTQPQRQPLQLGGLSPATGPGTP